MSYAQRPLSDAEMSQIAKGDLIVNDAFQLQLQQRSLVGTGENTPHDRREISKAQPSDRISPEKAKQILSDDSAQGHPLTEKQKGMFGAAAGRADKAQVDLAPMTDEEYQNRYGHPRGQKPHTHADETGGPDYAWESEKQGGPGTHFHGGNQNTSKRYGHKHEPPQRIGSPSRYDENARPQKHETPQEDYHGKPKTSDVQRRSYGDQRPDSTGNRYATSGRQAGEANSSPWGRGSTVNEPDFTGVQHPDRGRIQYPFKPGVGQVPAVPDTAGTDAPGGHREFHSVDPYGRNTAADEAGTNNFGTERAWSNNPRVRSPLGRKPDNRSHQSHPVFDRPLDNALAKAIADEVVKAVVSLDHESFGQRTEELSHRKGVRNPRALAAYIGRQKYGKKGMAERSAAGRHH